MSISAEQEVLISGMLETYVLEHHRGDLIQLLAGDHEETHQPVVINAMTLFEASMEVTPSQPRDHLYDHLIVTFISELPGATGWRLFECLSQRGSGYL